MDRWCGRVALVTGASSGIGTGIAASLVKNGMIVLGVARDVERIKVSLLFVGTSKFEGFILFL